MDTGLRISRIDAHSPHVATLAGWAHDEWGHLHLGRRLEAAIEVFRANCGPAGVPSVFATLQGEQPVGMASLVVDDMSDARWPVSLDGCRWAVCRAGAAGRCGRP
ncbi:hypothetical protein FHR97_003673 [Halomonas stenophila]|uniref:GNAT family N-acetyltransferase n=1 Tax=Halomonas stenophila TaxID=795312 RepID=A0A7W5HLE9_9GAMM|nr:hypothetical protein [Halomonas stenophila]